ncbi:MAG: LysR substrate-binding domain-containing protein, partial [Halofilum sp. (in: g-proteobacteria)]
LDEELGVTLLERRRGLVVPTRMAHLLLDEIERAYVSLDALRTFASRLAKGEGGEIVLGVMPALGPCFLPRVLSRFRAQWPETKVTLNVLMSVQVEEWAASQQIDLGLAEMPFRRTGFHSDIFSSVPYVAAVPAGHPLRSRACLYPADLPEGPFISWTPFVAASHLLDQAFQASGVQVEPICETTFSAPAYEMVKNGMGIAVVDPFTAIHQRDERAVLIPFRPSIPFNVGLLHPVSKPTNPMIDSLLDLMATERDAMLAELPAAPETAD